ncbi:hypothetical protein GCWU000324_01514 [Kingella oralis ATCC 51147]|uniref:Uncharacterized protein n=1 Tax=Kingella oralis ATCC 51147 TaxID=629741 RepID=C4GKL1_9NEIS|nr:hypothetical protein GCWU000324_01514 [Kingella oralis ATCC 51147]
MVQKNPVFLAMVFSYAKNKKFVASMVYWSVNFVVILQKQTEEKVQLVSCYCNC